ncbi:Calcium binding protein 39 [Fasciolopsis buskii]|uniref:Calcium binding protein 39 n=1 Tax=Fasciolopsis buskii TaxID=27845 RepID=A0A8E0RYC8_9TREM|nr:Calcium binding protein 39 [Fasciolopsis buski]
MRSTGDRNRSLFTKWMPRNHGLIGIHSNHPVISHIPKMPLFGKPKNPKELIQVVHENLLILSNQSKPEKERRKSVEEIARALSSLRELLTDKSDTRLTGRERDAELSNSERTRINEIITDVTHELINLNMLPLLIANLDVIEFESSKHVVDLFGHVMRRQVGSYNPAAQYLLANPSILVSLLQGYSKPDRAIHYGAMLRDACRHEALAKVVLQSPEFYQLFDYVQGTAFDVSSDAFSTLKDLLTRHKSLVAEFLTANYDEFFKHYSNMISAENYVTNRQALKLLGELLLERHNFSIMTKYIADAENLKLIMNLLKSEKKQIAFEAFHCFKVFVANPNKPQSVHMILFRNQEKLISFLSKFQNERTDDGQFTHEKEYLIKQIRDLKALPNSSSNLSLAQVATAARPP